MKCTILNRNYPPGSGITGNSANELAVYLEQSGIEVHVVTVGGDYQGGGAMNAKIHGTVHALGHLYNGKNKLLRLFSSLFEGWKMARKAVSIGCGPIICMTDPPLLNYWVSRQAKRRSIPWIYWSMDLYPEAFCAGGLVNDRNPLYRFLKRRLLHAPPNALIALGPNQAELIQGEYSEAIETVILPCGIMQSQETSTFPDWAVSDGKIVIGYAGNIGEAHSDTFIKSVIDAIDPAKHRFVLSAYGSKAQAILEYAQGREGITVVHNVAREHLQLIDVHVVTLLPGWDHVCVPSKAVSAVCEGAAVFICCTKLNDNWALLHKAAWRVDVDCDLPRVVSEFITKLTSDDVKKARENALQVSTKLLQLKERAFEEISQYVKLLQHAAT